MSSAKRSISAASEEANSARSRKRRRGAKDEATRTEADASPCGAVFAHQDQTVTVSVQEGQCISTSTEPRKTAPSDRWEGLLLQQRFFDQREAVLLRLSGMTTYEGDLVCLEEQATSLHRILQATVQKGEGNTLLLVGPRGSGKSAILQNSLRDLQTYGSSFHHVSISAKACPTDRLAMRELARQLIELGALSFDEQASAELDLREEEEEQENTFESSDLGDALSQPQDSLDRDKEDQEKAALGAIVLSSLANTTSSILSILASRSTSSTGAKPLIISLDSFELFTSRPRQALLYCLFDAVQAGSYQPGLAVVGMTRQPDATDLLEKRVKSRFSHRTIHCYPPGSTEDWVELVRRVLRVRHRTGAEIVTGQDPLIKKADDLFATAWQAEAETLLSDAAFRRMITRTVDLSRDVQLLFQMLYLPIATLDISRPALSVDNFLASEQSIRRDWIASALLYELPTMCFLLLIASKHLQTRDRTIFNFEMAFDEIAQFGRRSRRDREGARTGGLGLKADEHTALVALSPSKKGKRTLDSSCCGHAPLADWEDRSRVMIAFEQLLSLELFLPEAFLSSLSFGPSSLSAGADRVGSNKKNSTSASDTGTGTGRSQHMRILTDRSVILSSTATSSTSIAVSAPATVRKEYLRVRSILDPATIADVAKVRGKRGTLQTDVVQWAVRAG